MWVHEQAEEDPEEAYRQAAAVGDPTALHTLAGWLSEQPRRRGEADRTRRYCLDARGRPVPAHPDEGRHRRAEPRIEGGACRTASVSHPCHWLRMSDIFW